MVLEHVRVTAADKVFRGLLVLLLMLEFLRLLVLLLLLLLLFVLLLLLLLLSLLLSVLLLLCYCYCYCDCCCYCYCRAPTHGSATNSMAASWLILPVNALNALSLTTLLPGGVW